MSQLFASASDRKGFVRYKSKKVRSEERRVGKECA